MLLMLMLSTIVLLAGVIGVVMPLQYVVFPLLTLLMIYVYVHCDDDDDGSHSYVHVGVDVYTCVHMRDINMLQGVWSHVMPLFIYTRLRMPVLMLLFLSIACSVLLLMYVVSLFVVVVVFT